MTPAAALADRNGAVRAAARAWKRAGAIDSAALAAIEAAYPDERQGVGPVFRVLLFLFTLISIGGAFGLFLAFVDAAKETVLPVLLFLFGTGLIVATDFQVTGMKRTGGGTEAATSLAGIGFLAAFVYWAFDKAGMKDDHSVAAMLLAAASLLAVAAWRWGYPLYARWRRFCGASRRFRARGWSGSSCP